MLRRRMSDRVIAGVCSGIAAEYNLDVTVLRIIVLLGFVFFGVGPLAYLIAWILMPRDA